MKGNVSSSAHPRGFFWNKHSPVSPSRAQTRRRPQRRRTSTSTLCCCPEVRGKSLNARQTPTHCAKSLCKKHVFAFSFNHATALLGKVLALTTLILNYFKSCIQVQVHKYLLYTFPLSEKPFHFHPPRNGLIHNLERRKPVILNWRGGGRNNNNNNKNHTDKRSTQLCMVTED